MTTPWHERSVINGGHIIDVGGQPVYVHEDEHGARRSYLLDPFGNGWPVLELHHYLRATFYKPDPWTLAIEPRQNAVIEYVDIPDSLTTLEERVAWCISYAALTN